MAKRTGISNSKNQLPLEFAAARATRNSATVFEFPKLRASKVSNNSRKDAMQRILSHASHLGKKV